MKMKTRLGFILLILFQVLILVGWTAYNEVSLATGKEVVLQAAPLDPFDPFRGEFLQLRYDISTLRNVPGLSTLESGGRAYVRLEQHGEVWTAVEVSGTKHEDWDVFIAGKMNFISPTTATLTYGIESYFVPQGKGPEIERAQDIKARVRINGSGQGFIVGLIVDGEPFQLD